mmetsp:Transcript_31599/g.100319  ORF Transcript_31599/g.100319 Transcript_31599/m.100319 type:complete len:273 (+) Transcript_31599:444-1262(+)
MKEDGVDTRSFVYGEVSFAAFYEVLLAATAGMPRLGKFYDLGSGTGRAVFEAVLAVDCDIFVGIEILPRLHAAACTVAETYVDRVEPLLARAPIIRLYNGDITAGQFDWADGDLVFANSTCFEQTLLRDIARVAERLKPGARIITFTVALTSLWLRVVYKKKFNMSWGPATVYIHQKLSEEEYAERLRVGHTDFDDDQGVVYDEAVASGAKGPWSDTDSMRGQAPSYATPSEGGDDPTQFHHPHHATGAQEWVEEDEDGEEEVNTEEFELID